MNFNNTKPIYEQMGDRLCDEIISGKYKIDDRVPSVRDYAILLGVNTNTAFKSYEMLSREDIIYNKRGIGYYVANEAIEKISSKRKNEIIKVLLPELFRKMKLLKIDISEVVKYWKVFDRTNKDSLTDNKE